MIKRHSVGSAARLLATVISGLSFALPSAAIAQIAVIDGANLHERDRDESNSSTSADDKADEKGEQKAIVCTYSNKYRSTMFRRSPKEALERDASNVSLIRFYAKKYGVSEGLALSVSYQEARFDTCAGSHTGVKGAMQLTKATGRGLGFDRDINEQNIEGGVKLLGQISYQCGDTDYTCFAKHYNGSTAAEQTGWAAGVARYHSYFDSYVSSGKAPAAAPPAFSITTSSVGATKAVQSGGVNVVNKVASGLETSSAQRSEFSNLIDALAGGVGQKQELMDVWDENSTARTLNTQLLNQLMQGSLMINELFNTRLQQRSTRQSQASRLQQNDGTENPFSCDPVILRKQGVPAHFWPACAGSVAPTGNSEEQLQVPDAAAASRSLAIMQSQAR